MKKKKKRRRFFFLPVGGAKSGVKMVCPCNWSLHEDKYRKDSSSWFVITILRLMTDNGLSKWRVYAKCNSDDLRLLTRDKFWWGCVGRGKFLSYLQLRFYRVDCDEWIERDIDRQALVFGKILSAYCIKTKYGGSTSLRRQVSTGL